MSVTVQYLTVPTSVNGGSGSFTISGVFYGFNGLSVNEEGNIVTVNFLLTKDNISTSYSITASYNNASPSVNTTFTSNNTNSSASFTATSDDSLASFYSTILNGTLNQQSSTQNSLNGAGFVLTQTANGNSTTLSGNSGSTRDWLRQGGPILCQAYVASLVNTGTNVNAAIMTDAIGIAIAGLFH
jgi:hypothetical protein